MRQRHCATLAQEAYGQVRERRACPPANSFEALSGAMDTWVHERRRKDGSPDGKIPYLSLACTKVLTGLSPLLPRSIYLPANGLRDRSWRAKGSRGFLRDVARTYPPSVLRVTAYPLRLKGDIPTLVSRPVSSLWVIAGKPPSSRGRPIFLEHVSVQQKE